MFLSNKVLLKEYKEQCSQDLECNSNKYLNCTNVAAINDVCWYYTAILMNNFTFNCEIFNKIKILFKRCSFYFYWDTSNQICGNFFI